jgi:L-iditol 2-dehydrogenase
VSDPSPLPTMMTAVRVHGPGDLRVDRVEVPRPGPGDVLVRVRAVGVCTTDRKLAGRGTPGGGPRVLGHEIVGEVAAAPPAGDGLPLPAGSRVAVAPNVGDGTCRWCAAGATNYCPSFRAFGIHLDGGMADFLLVPRRAVAAGHLLPLPDALPDDRAALLEPLACCVEGLLTSALAPGERLVIVGAGVMGRLHVAAARALGAGRIVVLDRKEGRLAHARALGADATVLVAEGVRDADLGERVRAALGGGAASAAPSGADVAPSGADVVAVTVGDAGVVSAALRWLATGGRLNVFAGLPAGSRVEVDGNDLHYRRLQVLGTTGATLPTLRRTLDLLAADRVPLDGLVSATFELDRAADAFAAAARPEHARVLLRPAGAPGSG